MFACVFCEISKNTLFYRPPPVAASDKMKFTTIFIMIHESDSWLIHDSLFLIYAGFI